MRAMVDNPAAFGKDVKAADLYTQLGKIDYSKVDWKGTGLENAKKIHQDLWYQLFDHNDYNWASPEFLRPNHDYWPGIGEWD